MTRFQKWFALGVIATLTIVGTAQQQYSGGQAVTVSAALPAGTNLIGNVKVSDGTNFMPTGDSSARSIHVTTDNASQAVTQSGAWSVAANAGTNKIGIVYPYTSCGTTPVSQALVALPTVATAVTGSTACLINLYLHNSSNSTPYTVLVTDGAGTPVPFLNSITLNPGETREYNFPAGGPKFTTGLKWSASNVAVTGAAELIQ